MNFEFIDCYKFRIKNFSMTEVIVCCLNCRTIILQMGNDALEHDNPLDKQQKLNVEFQDRLKQRAYEQNNAAEKEQIRAPNILQGGGQKGPPGNEGLEDNQQIPLPKMGDDNRNDEQVSYWHFSVF